MLAVAIVLILLSGCSIYKSSPELRKTISERNIPLGEQWIAENVPGAEEISVHEKHSPYMVSSDVVEGSYKINGVHVDFILNVETNECITTEHNDELNNLLAKSFAEIIGVSHESVNVWVEGQKIQGHFVSDTRFNKQLDELDYDDYTFGGYGYLDFRIDSEGINDFVRESTFENAHEVAISITLPTDRDVMELFPDLDFIKEHYLCTVTVKIKDESSPTSSYMMYAENSEFKFIRLYVDEDGKIVSEVIAEEKADLLKK